MPVGADGGVVRDDAGLHVGLLHLREKLQRLGAKLALFAGTDGSTACDDIRVPVAVSERKLQSFGPPLVLLVGADGGVERDDVRLHLIMKRKLGWGMMFGMDGG